jgi:hypothetical protein
MIICYWEICIQNFCLGEHLLEKYFQVFNFRFYLKLSVIKVNIHIYYPSICKILLSQLHFQFLILPLIILINIIWAQTFWGSVYEKNYLLYKIDCFCLNNSKLNPYLFYIFRPHPKLYLIRRPGKGDYLK